MVENFGKRAVEGSKQVTEHGRHFWELICNLVPASHLSADFCYVQWSCYREYHAHLGEECRHVLGFSRSSPQCSVHLNLSPGDQQHVHSMAVGKHNIDNSPAFPAAYLAQVSSTSPPVTETQRRYCSHFEDWGAGALCWAASRGAVSPHRLSTPEIQSLVQKAAGRRRRQAIPDCLWSCLAQGWSSL